MISLEIEKLSKSYRSNVALRDVSFAISEPGIYGIVGSNGSGKTTLLKILAGLSFQDNGTVRLTEGDSRISHLSFLKRAGFLIGTPMFRPGIRGKDLLKLTASVKGYSSISELIVRVANDTGITEFIDKELYGYSRGMLQRLLLANALIGDPEVLVLDEPTSGLDPQSRSIMLDTIRRMDNGRRIVLMTSHDLWEVEGLCKKTIILESGNLLHGWIDLNEKGYVYFGLRDGSEFRNGQAVPLLGDSGETIYSVSTADFSRIRADLEKEMTFFRYGSKLPLEYLARNNKDTD